LVEESEKGTESGVVPLAGAPENAATGAEAPVGVVIRMRRKHAQRIGMLLKKTVNPGLLTRPLSVILVLLSDTK